MLTLTPAERGHMALLERYRKAMDLVGPGPLEPHFEDAAQAVGWFVAQGRWVDLGSGAGFPGLAFAARQPQARVTLVEPRQKRAAFLDLLLSQARLGNTELRRARSEELEPGLWDGIVSRAYKGPEELLPEARRLLRPQGQLLLLLARQDPPAAPDFELLGQHAYTLDERPRLAVLLRWTGA